MTFKPSDLADMDRLLQRARSVVAMREIAAGNHRPDVIGMRHDVDDNAYSFETAMNLARWEAARGFRSTYYVLHTASYWADGPFFRSGLEEIALAGHEVGIHTNAIAAALASGGDPDDILWTALDELREWGHNVTGAASHGDPICHDALFVNYEQFTECARAGWDPGRTLTYDGNELTLEPRPLHEFGLTYEAYHLPRGAYLSDTGGSWNWPPTDYVMSEDGQLHVLQHSDWWANAVSPLHEVAA